MPIHEDKVGMWKARQDSLESLRHFHVPHTYTMTSLSKAVHAELCAFSGALTKAIGAVTYLRAVYENGEVQV